MNTLSASGSGQPQESHTHSAPPPPPAGANGAAIISSLLLAEQNLDTGRPEPGENRGSGQNRDPGFVDDVTGPGDVYWAGLAGEDAALWGCGVLCAQLLQGTLTGLTSARGVVKSDKEGYLLTEGLRPACRSWNAFVKQCMSGGKRSDFGRKDSAQTLPGWMCEALDMGRDRSNEILTCVGEMSECVCACMCIYMCVCIYIYIYIYIYVCVCMFWEIVRYWIRAEIGAVRF
jgi:hypothetical protein